MQYLYLITGLQNAGLSIAIRSSSALRLQVKTWRCAVPTKKIVVFFSVLIGKYIVAQFECIFGVFTGIPQCKVEPLIVTHSIGVILHKKVVLILALQAKGAVQITVLELAIKHKAIRIDWFVGLLVLEALKFFEGRAVFIFDVEKAHLIF